MEYKNIPVSREIKNDFKQIQLDLSKKGIRKTEYELVKILLNAYKEYNKLISHKSQGANKK